MQRKCGFFSSRNREYHVHEEFCSTNYSPWSGARYWAGHNSNDDTAIQYRAVRNNTHYPSSFGWPCNDPYPHDTVDSCY